MDFESIESAVPPPPRAGAIVGAVIDAREETEAPVDFERLDATVGHDLEKNVEETLLKEPS